ncbi:MAG TPA: helix-turn-helix domain-containing protein [Plantibacter sp.]|uniref:helix-turn-helix domain-containing protein n=1 Tax=Plantibacter sp. TaxID=1871045 RepID=UPI002CB37C4E|nr:helix-turn-helix domain-containing protein [Plantibacter sp.]
MAKTALAPASPFMTLRELADYLRVSMRTAYQLAYDGKVPAVKVGGQWRIPRAALEEQFATGDELRRLKEGVTPG